MTMTTDRGMMGTSTMASPMMPVMSGMNMPMSSKSGMSMPGGMMIPRCTMKMEKVGGGMKMTCTCDDKTSAEMMKSLCMMNQGGMMSCSIMMNGMMCCSCNMGMMGMCKMEMTDMGMTMTCTSGDAMCMKMIQSCCDCMMSMMMPGCCMMMCMNAMPMCCMCI